MDELNLTPSLTLDAEPSAPTLTLEPEKEEEAPQAKPVSVEETPLSPEEQKMVDDFSEKIDITNSQQVLQYGAACQKKIGDFSDAALSKVRTKDMGEVGGMLTDLVSELKGFDANAQPQKGQQQPRPPPHRWFLRFRLCRAPSRHFISRRGRRNTVGCPHRRPAPEVKGAR